MIRLTHIDEGARIELAALKEEVERLSSSLATALDRSAAQAEATRIASERSDTLEATVERLTSQATSLSGTLDDVRHENERLLAAIGDLADGLRDRDRESRERDDDLRHEAQQLAAAIAALGRDMADRDSKGGERQAELRRKVDGLAAAVAALGDEVAGRDRGLRQMEADLRRLDMQGQIDLREMRSNAEALALLVMGMRRSAGGTTEEQASPVAER